MNISSKNKYFLISMKMIRNGRKLYRPKQQKSLESMIFLQKFEQKKQLEKRTQKREAYMRIRFITSYQI